jgi:hypothetical protein
MVFVTQSRYLQTRELVCVKLVGNLVSDQRLTRRLLGNDLNKNIEIKQVELCQQINFCVK